MQNRQTAPRPGHEWSVVHLRGVESTNRAPTWPRVVSCAGRELPWGSVTAWQPPERVAFRWFPGRDADTGQEVEVTFAADGEGATAVRLEHKDWHVFGEKAAAMRADYDGGWDGVLELYRRAAVVERV
ncbi:MAG TPA: SRPBCC domain-containing protein [Gemmatimonadota bacterium]|nr:SRPBCC domain-containing protein [Gemmatimonadota bacterium]